MLQENKLLLNIFLKCIIGIYSIATYLVLINDYRIPV